MNAVIQQLFAAFYQVTSFPVGSTNLAQISGSVSDYFSNSDFFFWFKMVLLIISVVLIVVIFILVNRMHELRHKMITANQVPPSEPATAGPLQNRWEEIMSHIDSPREAEWKYAIIEADKLVDDQLKNRFPGDTMGERLMNIDKTSLLSIDGLWEAHKVRNRLAHDINYFLRHAEAVRAIKLYEATLKELEAIQ